MHADQRCNLRKNLLQTNPQNTVKHLFYIHSNIVEIVAWLTIQHEGISESDVLVITDRGHTLKLIATDRQQSIDSKVINEALDASYTSARKALDDLDKILATLTDDQDFRLYVPQSSYEVIRAIITHPRCKCYAYLEEGIGSYAQHDTWMNRYLKAVAEYRRSIKYRVKESLRQLRLPRLTGVVVKHDFMHFKYHKAYVIDSRCMRNAPGQELLSLNRGLKAHFDQEQYAEYFGVPVLITDCYYQFSGTALFEVENAFRRILQFFIRNNTPRLWVKFHPKEHEETPVRKAYNRLIKDYADRIDVEIIPGTLSLEALSAFGENSFYYIYSSLGMYTRLLGSTAHCLVNEIAEADEKIRTYYNAHYRVIFEEGR